MQINLMVVSALDVDNQSLSGYSLSMQRANMSDSFISNEKCIIAHD